MASIYDLKPRFQALLRPLAGRLAGMGLRPNAITLLAIAGSVAAGALVSMASARPGLLLVLPVWLPVRMALNAIDGMMAREWGMATSTGAVLNEFGDVLSDLALYLPLAFVYEPARWPAVAFAIGAALTEFAGVLGGMLEGERRYAGPMGKSDRAFVVGALALVTWVTPEAFRLWPWVLSAAALLAALTCWNRIAKIRERF